MEKAIRQLFQPLEENGLKQISFLGLVTSSDSQVSFFGYYLGKPYQSNQLMEETDFDTDCIEQFYGEAVKAIRNAKEFDRNQLNIIKVYADGRFSLRCAAYSEDYFDIEEQWLKELMDHSPSA